MPIDSRILTLVAVFAIQGCGPDNGLTLGRVRGTVSYKGQPLRNGEISFMPDEARGNKGVPAMSPIGVDGTFLLSTDSPGDGAIIGFHKVAILALEHDPVPAPAEPPAKAQDSEEAPLREYAASKSKADRARRAARGPKTFRRGERYFRALTPESLSDPQTSGASVEVKSGSNSFHFTIQDDGSVRIE